MSDGDELDLIERRIEKMKGAPAGPDREGRLRRLLVDRERAQERQFKKSLERRAKRAP